MQTMAQAPISIPRLALLAVCLSLAGAVSFGCASKRKPTAEETLIYANERFDSGAYDLAIDGYKELLERHPFSEHAGESETKIAQAYYFMGRYPEAIAAFGDFERMHPTSPLVPLVTYYLGMSYLKQMRPLDRDQTASENAHAYFRAVTDRYPHTPWAERALLRLRECEEALAAHELHIANFYLRQDNLPAAEARLGRILQRYANTDVAGQALHVFAEAYLERNQDEHAALALLALVTHHPEDPLARQASATLERLERPGSLRGNPPTADPLELLILRLTKSPRGTGDPDEGTAEPPNRGSLSSEEGDAAHTLPAKDQNPLQFAPSPYQFAPIMR